MKTYWSSQSLRTLNHWQSNERGVWSNFTGTIFSGFKIDGNYYITPLAMREHGATIEENYVWGDSRNQVYVEGHNAQPQQFSLYASEKNVTQDLKHIIKAVWNLGNVKMESFAQTISGVTDADFPLQLCRNLLFRPLPGQSGTYETISVTLNTPQYSTLNLDCAIPIFKKLYGVFVWYEDGYENLIPQFLRDLTGTETQYTGSQSAISTFNDYNFSAGPPQAGLVQLNNLYDTTQSFNLRVQGNLEKYTENYVALPTIYSNLGGCSLTAYTDTDDADTTQKGFSQAVSRLKSNTNIQNFQGTLPLEVGSQGNHTRVRTTWSDFNDSIYDYNTQQSRYTHSYNSIRLFDNNVQVGAIYSNIIYIPTEIRIENVPFITIER